MKATEEQYTRAYEISNEQGPSAVYDFAVREGITSYSPCTTCDVSTPDTHDNFCLMCGAKKE